MNEQKLSKLFKLAGAERPPAVPEGFQARVLRELRRNPEDPPLAKQLTLLFPRLVSGAAFIIALCVAGDYYLATANLPDVAEGVARISDQWLLPFDCL
jgi:hypothetical protein